MSDQIKPLPLLVDHYAGESATSLASRLARRNGAGNMRSFCTDQALDYAKLKSGHEADVTRLAALAGIDPRDLEFWTPKVTAPGQFQLGWQSLKFTALRRSSARACPECMRIQREKDGPFGPFHLGIWQLASIRTCSRHQCLLVDLPLPSHHRNTSDFCQLLEDYEPPEPQYISSTHRALEIYLENRVSGHSEPNWLDQFDFHVAAQCCENFGLLLTHGPSAARTKLSEREWLIAGAKGFEVLKGGQDAWLTSLEELRQSSGPGYVTYGAVYGVFARWLQSRLDDVAFFPLRDIFRAYLLSAFPFSEDTMLLGLPTRHETVFTLKRGVEILGVDRRTLAHELLKSGFMVRDKTTGRTQMVTYPNKPQLEKIAARIGEYMRGQRAAEYLGVQMGILRKLVKAGYVKQHSMLARNAPVFRRSDLDGFLSRLHALISDTPEIRGDEVSLLTATANCQCSLAELLHIILESNVALLAPGPQATLSEMRVSIRQLLELANRDQVALTYAETAELLRVDTQTVSHLVEDGFLATIRKVEKSSRRWRIVEKISVETFSAEYISAAELASDLRQDAANLCISLYHQGAEPLILRKKSRILFRRRDVS